MNTNQGLLRRIADSPKARLLTAFAVLGVALALLSPYNPFGKNNTSSTTHAVKIEKNAGGLPIGMPWVKQTTMHGVNFQQNWAGASPDYPNGVPLMTIEGVPTTTALCAVGTGVASYARVNHNMFVSIAGCHSLNDALAHNDHIGCYNAAAAIYNSLNNVLKGAPHSLSPYDMAVMKNNLDLNFNGYHVADACGYSMSTGDPRGTLPVTFIQ